MAATTSGWRVKKRKAAVRNGFAAAKRQRQHLRQANLVPACSAGDSQVPPAVGCRPPAVRRRGKNNHDSSRPTTRVFMSSFPCSPRVVSQLEIFRRPRILAWGQRKIARCRFMIRRRHFSKGRFRKCRKRNVALPYLIMSLYIEEQLILCRFKKKARISLDSSSTASENPSRDQRSHPIDNH